jgi:hypothetical protein
MVAEMPERGSDSVTAVAESRAGAPIPADVRSSAAGGVAPAVGFRAAVLATVLTASFAVLAIVAADTDPWGGIEAHAETFRSFQVLQLIPVLLLAPVVVVLMAAIHHVAPEPRRLFTHMTLVFAGAYAAVIVTNYTVQLYVVRLHLLSGDLEGLDLLAMANPRSIFVALETTGYAFFGMAALSASGAFTGAGVGAWIRRLLMACGGTGILGAIGALVDQGTLMLTGFGLSLVAFFAATPLLAIYFRRLECACP